VSHTVNFTAEVQSFSTAIDNIFIDNAVFQHPVTHHLFSLTGIDTLSCDLDYKMFTTCFGSTGHLQGFLVLRKLLSGT
jgi:hypothetical protein